MHKLYALKNPSIPVQIQSNSWLYIFISMLYQIDSESGTILGLEFPTAKS